MRRSLNEVTSEMQKACRGAGYTVGEAEELSLAASTLITLGLDGVKALLDGVGKPLKRTEQNVETLNQILEAENFHVAQNGSVLFELLLCNPNQMGATLNNVDAPLLLVGIATKFAKSHQCLIEVSGVDFALSIGPNVEKLTIPEDLTTVPSLTVELKRDCFSKNTKKQSAISRNEDGIEVNEAIWPEISKLARKTYVPASEASRLNGAGATINDND